MWDVYSWPMAFFGTTVYFGGKLTGHTGCISSTVSLGSLFVETTNTNQ